MAGLGLRFPSDRNQRDRFGWLRHVLGGSWRVVAAWEREEPSIPRAPLPVKWLRALVVCALTLKLCSTASALLVGFFGLLRPIEIYTVSRRDVLLAKDHQLGH